MQVAVIPYDARAGDTVDDVLRRCALALKEEGFALAGAVQINAARSGFSRCDMFLEDLKSGVRTDTTDNRRASDGCRLDATALEDAAGLAQASITADTDLLIVNRFGKQEALGQGFRGAIEAAVLLGVPVLTSFSPANRDAFDAFSGGTALRLPAEAGPILAWCRSAIAERRRLSAVT